MNESLTINFSLSDYISDKYWVRLEQVETDVESTLGELADLIGEIFEIDPCIESEDTEEVADSEEVPDNPDESITDDTIESVFAPEVPIERSAFNVMVQDMFPMEFCDLDGSGNYIVQIKVVLSHPGEQYTLRLDNGEILGTVITEDTVTDKIIIDDLTGVVLDYPVVGEGKFEWGRSSSSTPTITRTGNTLNWGANVTGSIDVEYPTRYDLVDILVYVDEEGNQGECKVVGFYHGLVDELELTAPEDEDGDDVDREEFCGTRTHWEFPPDTPGLPQWITIETMYYCVCSGEYDHSEYSQQPTPTDMAKNPPTHIFPGITKVQDGGFIDCGEEDGDLNDPAFYEEVCCHPPDVNLPDCVTRHTKNPGEKLDPDVQESLIEQYGDRLQVTYLMPPDGDCGTDTYTQKKLYRNCCEDVLPIVWDNDHSIETIGPNDSGYIFTSGGKGPYTFKVLGEGFFFSGGRKQITLDHGSTFVYTIDACGPGTVIVEDACGQAVLGYIRCSTGTWVYQGDDTPEARGNVVCGVGTWYQGGITFRYEYIEGFRKTDQSYTHRFHNSNSDPQSGHYCGYCLWSQNCPELDPVDWNCSRCVTNEALNAFPHYCNADTYSDIPCTWENPPEEWLDMYTIQPVSMNVYVWECP